MTCREVVIGGQRAIICSGPPMREAKREQDGEPRWCFACRKRREFHYVVDVPTELSYYGPTYSVECAVCGTRDGDLFPGREREWEEI